MSLRHSNALDDARRAVIRSAYAGGATLKELAAAHGVHLSTISRTVHGRRPRGVKRKLTMAQAEELRRLHRDEGLKPSKLRRLFGISESAVYLILGDKHYRK